MRRSTVLSHPLQLVFPVFKSSRFKLLTPDFLHFRDTDDYEDSSSFNQPRSQRNDPDSSFGFSASRTDEQVDQVVVRGRVVEQ